MNLSIINSIDNMDNESKNVNNEDVVLSELAADFQICVIDAISLMDRLTNMQLDMRLVIQSCELAAKEVALLQARQKRLIEKREGLQYRTMAHTLSTSSSMYDSRVTRVKYSLERISVKTLRGREVFINLAAKNFTVEELHDGIAQAFSSPCNSYQIIVNGVRYSPGDKLDESFWNTLELEGRLYILEHKYCDCLRT